MLAQQGPFQLYEVEGNRIVGAPRYQSPRLLRLQRHPGSQCRRASAWPDTPPGKLTINIRKPGEPMDHRTADGYRSNRLDCGREFVRRVATSLHGAEAEAILRSPVATIDPERCIALDRSLRSALGRLASQRNADAPAPQIQEFLIDWFSAVLGITPGQPPGPLIGGSALQAAAWYRKAEEYMSSQLERPMNLLEICEAVGVSERTLLSAFRERIGCPQRPISRP